MATPVTAAQQALLDDAVRRYLALTPEERAAQTQLMLDAQAKFRDAIAIPCNKPEK